MSLYDKHPCINVKGQNAWRGYDAILWEWQSRIAAGARVLVIDAYPGVRDEEVLEQLRRLSPDVLIDMRDIFKPEHELTDQMAPYLTDDRVFGRMYYGDIDDFLDSVAVEEARALVSASSGLVIVYGFGAARVVEGDVLCYFDMTRWEIQLRYRSGMGNYKCSNGSDDNLRKYKRGFFVEWRIADKHKQRLFNSIDYVVDTAAANDPRMVTGDGLITALHDVTSRPFRTVPYFDPGVWGGQWMKEVCSLDQNQSNYAWSFDGVPEENELILCFGGVDVHVPAMDLVLLYPRELLGDNVYARFGAEYPIRFDLLDTMGGQNLSLQVHPTTEYIHRQFGMAYTQDESYYLLDAGPDACVYLGLKEGVDSAEMLDTLRRANAGGGTFNADHYVNKFSAKKHDHFLIPAGTIHCSGANAMVLEISATPYIFTFKLWDWGRVGLDGRPRPVHLEHGEQVINWNRSTGWVKDNLVNQAREVSEVGCGAVVERTGLHELEYIETRRYTFSGVSHHDTCGTVHMLNLVEGAEVVVESPVGAFEPFYVHYAETFIIPAAVGRYTVKPAGDAEGQEVKLIKAYVRS